jgi:hypothetical protein
MPEVLVLEFADLDVDPIAMYRAVNDVLGIDSSTGEGKWPTGLLDHTAAVADGRFVVVERWASRADQEAFMTDRLGPAFGQTNTPTPVRVSWYSEVGRKVG